MANPPKPRPQLYLHVVQAFDEDDEGNLIPRPAEQFETADRAKRQATALARGAAGVLAWSRSADPDVGEYGPPTIIFQAGRVPDEME